MSSFSQQSPSPCFCRLPTAAGAELFPNLMLLKKL
jgi:hypothetical protein